MGLVRQVVAASAGRPPFTVRVLALAVVAALIGASVPALAGDQCGCSSPQSASSNSTSFQGCSCSDSTPRPSADSGSACEPNGDSQCACASESSRGASHGGAVSDDASCGAGCCGNPAADADRSGPGISSQPCGCQVAAAPADCGAPAGTLLAADAAVVAEAMISPRPVCASAVSNDMQTRPLLLALPIRDRSPPHLP